MATNTMVKGAVAGLAGVAAMTVTEKLEQQITGRPDSYVPSRTLAHLVGLRRPDADLPARNHLMHWGTGALLGVVRALLSARGLRGPKATLAHTLARFGTDQALENGTGVGSPPWTWPRQELAIDIAHKAVYGVVTGWVADRLVPATRATAAGGAASVGVPADAVVVAPQPEDVMLPVVDGPEPDEAADETTVDAPVTLDGPAPV